MPNHSLMVARIQGEALAELSNLARLMTELQEVMDEQGRSGRIVLRATASILADFYNGVERTLKVILSELDGGLPRGDDWHRQLLANAKIATSTRPPIIHEDLFTLLLPYLGFRHVVRNAYGFELDADRVNKLAANAASVANVFQAEVAAFVDKIPELV